ncbi:MAG: M23 family metallopeptidase [Clostridiales bacterium]|nr:M23 family metallopeptidase [Clostridiales bacterium]
MAVTLQTKETSRLNIALSVIIFLALGALSVFGVVQGVEEREGRALAAQGAESAVPSSLAPAGSQESASQTDTTKASYIKWVEFNAPYAALSDTLALDIKTHENGPHVSWIDSLAWLACKNGGNWKGYKSSQLQKLKDALADGKTVDELMADNKYYDYYKRAYTAVLGGMVGEYEKEAPDKEHEGQKIIVKKYGLKAYCPIAEGFGYSHYDDFGDSRSYGYRRRHLGNDLLGAIGTPIVAVEGGIVEAYGWNQYGGWRLGIRSFDGKRSYYYAHLRKGHPYQTGIQLGSKVKAGQVIGYLGATGYSTKEDNNGMTQPHLHIGLQLVFDESQKEGINQIWLNLYPLIELLNRNKATVVRDEESKEYYRKYDIFDPAYPKELQEKPKTTAPPVTTTQAQTTQQASAAQ